MATHSRRQPAGGPAGGRSARPSWIARPRWRLVRGDAIALGPGKADLLDAIAATGSISAAAAALGMSYRRAWLLVDTMNRCFRRPLVATLPRRSAGAALTSDGAAVLALYRSIETQSQAAVRPHLSSLLRLLRPS